MADIRTMEFESWNVGTPTKYSPTDEAFLRAAMDAGFDGFTHSGGLFGAKSEHRAVQIVHRGRGVRWEVIFLEHDSDVVTTTTTDLEQMTSTILNWLSGKTLSAKENSIQSVVG